MPTLKTSCDASILEVFPSALGWMALVTSGDALRELTFGHPNPGAALRALSSELVQGARPGAGRSRLVQRLQAYANGEPDDFHDVRLDLGSLSQFQRRVLARCRRIPYGRTMTYGQLAAGAGSPRAARAVGTCMARNRIPLIIPCHRVVAVGARLGGYSACGMAMKRRLLDMEAGN